MVEKILYKNKPILVITDDSKTYRRISFGINKAKLILSAIAQIQEFIKENEVVNS